MSPTTPTGCRVVHADLSASSDGTVSPHAAASLPGDERRHVDRFLHVARRLDEDLARLPRDEAGHLGLAAREHGSGRRDHVGARGSGHPRPLPLRLRRRRDRSVDVRRGRRLVGADHLGGPGRVGGRERRHVPLRCCSFQVIEHLRNIRSTTLAPGYVVRPCPCATDSRSDAKPLTPSERRVAAIVLDDPEAVAFGTVAEPREASGNRRCDRRPPRRTARLRRVHGPAGRGARRSRGTAATGQRAHPPARRARRPRVAHDGGRGREPRRRRSSTSTADALRRAIAALAVRRARVVVLPGGASVGVARQLCDELCAAPARRHAWSRARPLRWPPEPPTSRDGDVVVAIDLRRYDGARARRRVGRRPACRRHRRRHHRQRPVAPRRARGRHARRRRRGRRPVRQPPRRPRHRQRARRRRRRPASTLRHRAHRRRRGRLAARSAPSSIARRFDPWTRVHESVTVDPGPALPSGQDVSVPGLPAGDRDRPRPPRRRSGRVARRSSPLAPRLLGDAGPSPARPPPLTRRNRRSSALTTLRSRGVILHGTRRGHTLAYSDASGRVGSPVPRRFSLRGPRFVSESSSRKRMPRHHQLHLILLAPVAIVVTLSSLGWCPRDRRNPFSPAANTAAASATSTTTTTTTAAPPTAPPQPPPRRPRRPRPAAARPADRQGHVDLDARPGRGR